MRTKEVASCIITNNKGEFLLQKKTADYPDGGGIWVLFGGRIDEGETSEETIRREIKEELNINTSFEFLKKVEWIAKTINGDDFLAIESVFKTIIDKPLYFPNEGAGMAFFTKEEIKKLNTTSFVKELLI